ncbi:molybdenum cofactor guanylyltransferase [Tumebacillus sp. ITR2]|uniref:Probable molybdenum cofactor guanylyltransferase n=1 Tax=Tumebacillus amylolyticus TaxID=2801339 RepID=A0ABS1JG05_9BACL|nr:molybdenum cofactor guanylyltransferase [Tumebacillus amylolyticus]MBL0389206.1 molybdenum cofactor guanylyltransferase [Tumebacillus amylolyticus]
MGGRSKRMGVSKQWLPFANRPLLLHSYDRLRTVCQEVVAVTNDVQDQQRVQDLGLRAVRDFFPDQGPLAGLHAGLQGLEEHQTAVLLGCDLPFLRRQVLQDLIHELERDPELDAVVPCEGGDGHLYPVCAVYRARVRQVAEEHLRRGENAMRRFLAEIRVLYIPTERWAACSPHPFFNMNTPEDYEEACILWKREGFGDHE